MSTTTYVFMEKYENYPLIITKYPSFPFHWVPIKDFNLQCFKSVMFKICARLFKFKRQTGWYVMIIKR